MAVHYKQGVRRKHDIARVKSKRYQEAFKQVMEWWEIYHEEYCTILDKYKVLLQKKRNLKLIPLYKIKQSLINTFPKIEFLEIEDRVSAEEYLLCLPDYELYELKDAIDLLYIHGKVRGDLISRIIDFQCEIDRKCRKDTCATTYAIDSDPCEGGWNLE